MIYRLFKKLKKRISSKLKRLNFKLENKFENKNPWNNVLFDTSYVHQRKPLWNWINNCKKEHMRLLNLIKVLKEWFFFKGKEFKNRIKSFIKEFDDFHIKILPFISETNGKKILNDWLNLISQSYPWYVDEMKGENMKKSFNNFERMPINVFFKLGLSEGSEIEFDWVFDWDLIFIIFRIIWLKSCNFNRKTKFKKILAINLRVELLHLTSKSDCYLTNRAEDTSKECSDFFLINEKNVCNNLISSFSLLTDIWK